MDPCIPAAGAAQPENCPPLLTALLDLPPHLLLVILQHLDLVSLCSIARCNRQLLRLCSHPSLWPDVMQLYATTDWCLGSVRLVLSDILKLPPQVFHAAQLDVRRSRRFPALVPMHNLRTILATADAEGLAERVSRALQDRLHKAHNSLWRHDTWQQLPPAASMTICRADGASIRAALRPQAVVPRLVQQLQQTGWPQCQLPGSLQQVIPPDCSSTSSRADPLLDSQPGLLQVLHLCQHRMHLLHTQQLPQLQHLRGACTPVPGLDKTQGAAAASKKAAGCWRPNMTAVQAAAAKLPTEDVVRQLAAKVTMSSSSSQGAMMASCEADDAATGLAVRLFWAGVVTDPSRILSYSAAGSALSQWQLPLAQAARVVGKLHALQQATAEATGSPLPSVATAVHQLCHPATSTAPSLDACCADMQPAWQRAAGSAELQLCLSGLHQLLEAVASEQPVAVYRCIHALDVAVGEYWAAYSTESLGFTRTAAMSSSVLAPTDGSAGDGHHTELVKCCMHTELLRAFSWCLWLLGVLL